MRQLSSSLKHFNMCRHHDYIDSIKLQQIILPPEYFVTKTNFSEKNVWEFRPHHLDQDVIGGSPATSRQLTLGEKPWPSVNFPQNSHL